MRCQRPDLFYALGEYKGSSIAQIVAVDGGDDAVTKVKFFNGMGQAVRFGEVNARRPACSDSAVVAATGTYTPKNHEGSTTAFPTFSNVGALGFLTYGVECIGL